MRLKFELNDTQLCAVSESLTKLENAHRAKAAWFDDYVLEGSSLIIHALDLYSVLDHCERNSENEMDLFRLRKSATDQMTSLLEKSKVEIKKHNINLWLDHYKKLWPGTNSDNDLTAPPYQPNNIELIP